jgi:hypothetical protein
VAEARLDAAGRLNAQVLQQDRQLEVNPAGQGMQAFNSLAGYIFGNNRRRERMAMTTPVLTTSSGAMQFMIGSASHKVCGRVGVRVCGVLSPPGACSLAAGACAAVCAWPGAASSPASACAHLPEHPPPGC